MEFGPEDDPLLVLERWKAAAEEAREPLPEAMTLATVTADGRPRARVVLWRGRSGRALHFFTNYASDKARELEASPFAALVFHFPTPARQVRIEGVVGKLSAAESDAYFRTRPRESQIGAWASKQSENLTERAELEERVAAFEARFAGGPVPRPAHWGGFALTAERIELWSGQVGRLHDRAVYSATPEGWAFQRLYP